MDRDGGWFSPWLGRSGAKKCWPQRHRDTEKNWPRISRKQANNSGHLPAATQDRPYDGCVFSKLLRGLQAQTFFSFQRPRRKTSTPTTASVENAIVIEAKTPRGPSPATRART